MEEKLLISPSEASKMLGICSSKMYALIHDGVIPAVKLPGCRRLYISVDVLKQVIKDNTASGPINRGDKANE